MGQRLTLVPDERLDQLCRSAEERTAALGHVLGEWDEEGEITRRAVCVQCGRAVYVRVEGKLAGMAGRAVGERCE